uniref:Uncharacterized protein n=1 Tax=Micrurus spixii TaxID=129469 RepID=A0A2D4LSP5_9SAUR
MDLDMCKGAQPSVAELGGSGWLPGEGNTTLVSLLDFRLPTIRVHLAGRVTPLHLLETNQPSISHITCPAGDAFALTSFMASSIPPRLPQPLLEFLPLFAGDPCSSISSESPAW